MKQNKIILVCFIVFSLVLTSCEYQKGEAIKEMITGAGEEDGGSNPAFVIRHDGNDLFSLTHGAVATFSNNLTANLFKGLFNWTSADDWNTFDGNTLDFNESKLSTTVIDMVGNWTADKSSYQIWTTTKAYIDSIGNWTADKVNYYTSTETDNIISTLPNLSLSDVSDNIGNWSDEKENYYNNTEIDELPVSTFENDAGYFDNIVNFTGTLTNGKTCTYDSGNTEIDCDTTLTVGTVTSVTGSSPIVSSEGTTPAISITMEGDLVTTAPLTGGVLNIFPGSGTKATIAIPVATSIADGYLDKDDWTIFNNKADSDTTYSAGQGISEALTVFTVAGGTALTQDAGGLSVTDGGIGDTQIADAYINQALTTTSDVTHADLTVNNITSVNCIYFDSGGRICSGT